MESRVTACSTCKRDEEHRPLTRSEKDWAKEQTGRKNVDDFLVCTAEGCRNLRTTWTPRPFKSILRLP